MRRFILMEVLKKREDLSSPHHKKFGKKILTKFVLQVQIVSFYSLHTYVKIK